MAKKRQSEVARALAIVKYRDDARLRREAAIKNDNRDAERYAMGLVDAYNTVLAILSE